jgi:two-component system, chemotaxis family, chemotaxis protein CheY
MNTSPTFQALLARMPERVAHFRIARGTKAARTRPHVLVVEDQLFSRKLLQEILHHDFAIDMASSGKEGLNMFLQFAPDVVFLDIELMDENGHSLARVIKALDPETYIVMVTANNTAEDVAQSKANGVNGFVAKPYSKGKIFESLANFKPAHKQAPT